MRDSSVASGKLWPALGLIWSGRHGLLYVVRGIDDVLNGLGDDIETYTGHERVQGPQRGTGVVAPVVEVGVLPPPQRLQRAALLVVAQPVHEVARDVDQVVGEPVRGRLGVLVRVEDLDVLVEHGESLGEPLSYGVQVRVV